MLRQKKGFTLIELLVVIAIIAILAAILFPVFAKARAKARQSVCLSNMKQLGNACMMYIQDYDGTWLNIGICGTAGKMGLQLAPYVGNNRKLFECPEDPNSSAPWVTMSLEDARAAGYAPSWMVPGGALMAMDFWSLGAWSPTNPTCCSYSMNTWICSGMKWGQWNDMMNGAIPLADVPPLSESSIEDPASTIALADGNQTYHRLDCTDNMYMMYRSNNNTSDGEPAAFHSGGGNVACCDGHAKWLSLSGMTPYNGTNGCYLTYGGLTLDPAGPGVNSVGVPANFIY